jgi:dipeptidase
MRTPLHLLILFFLLGPILVAEDGISTDEALRRAARQAAEEDALYGPTPEGCTCISLGRLATTDGSVITSHTCDGRYRTWLDVTKAGTHEEGAMAPIYKGRMRTEFPADERGVEKLGEIPQATETFAILDTAYPCMNERQLAMGESTFTGKEELKSDKGIFHVEELQRIALERCTAAREAVELMGALAVEYGYIDSGEILTVADPKEVWHFEILGPGDGNKGAVWAAKRIPDDHVSVAANLSRISEIDLDDPENYLASENVFSLAREMGWWDPGSGEPFKFWKAYSGKKPFRAREFWVFDTLAPSLKLDFVNSEEMPFSVKPERKVSVQDVFELFRTTYEGSEFALNKNLLVEKEKPKTEEGEPEPVEKEMEVCIYAHPWMPRNHQALFNTLKPGSVTFHRPIAVMFNAYHTVIQCRDWLPDPIGGMCWLGFDNPATTPRAPIFCGVTDLPPDFKVDNHKQYRTDSASWAFRRASRLACFRWGQHREKIQKKILELEEQALFDLRSIEARALDLFQTDPDKAREFLTRYTDTFCRSMTHQYWELGDELWMEYLYRL